MGQNLWEAEVIYEYDFEDSVSFVGRTIVRETGDFNFVKEALFAEAKKGNIELGPSYLDFTNQDQYKGVVGIIDTGFVVKDTFLIEDIESRMFYKQPIEYPVEPKMLDAIHVQEWFYDGNTKSIDIKMIGSSFLIGDPSNRFGYPDFLHVFSIVDRPKSEHFIFKKNKELNHKEIWWAHRLAQPYMFYLGSENNLSSWLPNSEPLKSMYGVRLHNDFYQAALNGSVEVFEAIDLQKSISVKKRVEVCSWEDTRYVTNENTGEFEKEITSGIYVPSPRVKFYQKTWFDEKELKMFSKVIAVGLQREAHDRYGKFEGYKDLF